MADLNFESNWDILDGVSLEPLCDARNCDGAGLRPHPDGHTPGLYCGRCVFEHAVLGHPIQRRPAPLGPRAPTGILMESGGMRRESQPPRA